MYAVVLGHLARKFVKNAGLCFTLKGKRRMEIARIEGATRELGKPKDWDEVTDGHCSSLPIKDVVVQSGMQFMISAWKPSLEELHLLAKGESIKLWIQGTSHPVVALTVGDIE